MATSNYTVIIRTSLNTEGLKEGQRQISSVFGQITADAEKAARKEADVYARMRQTIETGRQQFVGSQVQAAEKINASIIADAIKTGQALAQENERTAQSRVRSFQQSINAIDRQEQAAIREGTRAVQQSEREKLSSFTSRVRTIDRQEQELVRTTRQAERDKLSSFTSRIRTVDRQERDLVRDLNRYENERRKMSEENDRAIQRSAKVTADIRVREGRRTADQMLRDFQRVEDAARRPSRSGALLAGAAGGIAALVGVSAISQIRAAGAAWLDYSSKLETTKIAFTTMLGSAQAAQEHLNELQQFALKTPFQFADLIDASQRMQALGFEAKRVRPILEDVGNAVAAAGGGRERLDRVVLALSQMQSKGKVATQELNQLAESGISGFKILEAQLGKSRAELVKMVEAGEISADTFLTAFQKFSQQNFGGLMEQQAKTFSGAMSNIKDALLITSSTAFKPLYERLSETALRLGELSTQSKEFQRNMETIGNQFVHIWDGAIEALYIFRDAYRLVMSFIVSRVAVATSLVESMVNRWQAAFYAASAVFKFAGRDVQGALQDMEKSMQATNRANNALADAFRNNFEPVREMGKIYREAGLRAEEAATKMNAAARAFFRPQTNLAPGVQVPFSTRPFSFSAPSTGRETTTPPPNDALLTSAAQAKAERAAAKREEIANMREVLVEVAVAFKEEFGKVLPIRFGQTALHQKLRYDHRAAADISLDPRSAQGQFVMETLRELGVPFRASLGREVSQTTGKLISTGAHIHAGQLSRTLGTQERLVSESVLSRRIKEEEESRLLKLEVERNRAARARAPIETLPPELAELPVELQRKWDNYFENVTQGEDALRDRRKDFAAEHLANQRNLLTELGNLELDLAHIREQSTDDQFIEQRRLLAARSEEVNLLRQIAQAEDDIATGPYNASLRVQLGLLENILEVRQREEDVIIATDRAQRELADQTILHMDRANLKVLEFLAAQRSVTDVIADARIGVIQGTFDLIDAGLDRATKKLGVMGNAIRDLLSGFVRLALNKAFAMIFGGGGPTSNFSGGGGGGIFGGLFGGGGQTGGGGILSGIGNVLGNIFRPSALTGGFAGGASPAAGLLGLGGQAPALRAAGSGLSSLFGGASPFAAFGGGISVPASTSAAQQSIFGQIAANASQGATAGAAGAATGTGGLLSGLGQTLPFLLPFLGALLGSGLGGSSGLGGILGGIGGLALGAAGATALLGGSLGVSATVFGLTGSAGAAGLAGTIGALATNPFTIAAAAALLIGSIILGRNRQRRREEQAREELSQQTIAALKAMLTAAEAGQLTQSDAVTQFESLRKAYFDTVNTFRDSKTKRIATDWWYKPEHPPQVYWKKIEAAAKAGETAQRISSQFIPTFQHGGEVEPPRRELIEATRREPFNPAVRKQIQAGAALIKVRPGERMIGPGVNQIVPGVDRGMDSVYTLAIPGTRVLTKVQQAQETIKRTPRFADGAVVRSDYFIPHRQFTAAQPVSLVPQIVGKGIPGFATGGTLNTSVVRQMNTLTRAQKTDEEINKKTRKHETTDLVSRQMKQLPGFASGGILQTTQQTNRPTRQVNELDEFNKTTRKGKITDLVSRDIKYLPGFATGGMVQPVFRQANVLTGSRRVSEADEINKTIRKHEVTDLISRQMKQVPGLVAGGVFQKDVLPQQDVLTKSNRINEADEVNKTTRRLESTDLILRNMKHLPGFAMGALLQPKRLDSVYAPDSSRVTPQAAELSAIKKSAQIIPRFASGGLQSDPKRLDSIYVPSSIARKTQELNAMQIPAQTIPALASGGLLRSDYFIPQRQVINQIYQAVPKAERGLLELPGSFDRKDDLLMRVSRGERVAVMTPDQFERIGGKRAFEEAGVPSVRAANGALVTPNASVSDKGNIVIQSNDNAVGAILKAALDGQRSSDGRRFIVETIDSHIKQTGSDGILGTIQIGLTSRTKR